jgi:hypothetical protein
MTTTDNRRESINFSDLPHVDVDVGGDGPGRSDQRVERDVGIGDEQFAQGDVVD